MTKDVWITTIDNPYNPFTDFDNWQRYDESKGYYTCEYLARITVNSNNISEFYQEQEINQAIDEIVKYNILGIYKKVTKEDYNTNAS